MISKSVLVSMQTPGGVDHIDLPQFFSFIFKIYFKVTVSMDVLWIIFIIALFWEYVIFLLKEIFLNDIMM